MLSSVKQALDKCAPLKTTSGVKGVMKKFEKQKSFIMPEGTEPVAEQEVLEAAILDEPSEKESPPAEDCFDFEDSQAG